MVPKRNLKNAGLLVLATEAKRDETYCITKNPGQAVPDILVLAVRLAVTALVLRVRERKAGKTHVAAALPEYEQRRLAGASQS